MYTPRYPRSPSNFGLPSAPPPSSPHRLQGRLEDLLDFEARAPGVGASHPSTEHILPLFVALGAAQGGRGEAIFRGWQFTNLALTSFEWKAAEGGGAAAAAADECSAAAA